MSESRRGGGKEESEGVDINVSYKVLHNRKVTERRSTYVLTDACLRGYPRYDICACVCAAARFHGFLDQKQGTVGTSLTHLLHQQ